MGFGVPIDDWLRGPLRAWAEDLLAERRLTADGILTRPPSARALARPSPGHAQLAIPLWTVLMFQAWKARWMG